jgi:hypothetical protein
MTQRLVPVIPPPPSSEPEEIILAASRPAAPLFGDRTARAGTPAFVTAPAASSAVFDDDTALSRPEEIRFGDSTAPGLGDVPAELPTPPPQPAASYDATGDDAEPYAPQAPYASSEPYAPEAPYSAPEEAPATPADASPPEAQPTASEGLSAKVDAAMSDAAPRVRRRIPRSVELASTAILPTAPPPRTVRSSTLGLATVGTVLLAALAGWVLLRDNPRRPAAAPRRVARPERDGAVGPRAQRPGARGDAAGEALHAGVWAHERPGDGHGHGHRPRPSPPCSAPTARATAR